MPDIIFVSYYLGRGGAARVLLTLAEEFADNGFNTTILSCFSGEDEYRVPDGVSIQYGPDDGAPSSKRERIRWIRGQVKDNPNAVVVAFEYFINMQVLLACRGLPNRVVVSERNDPARVGSEFPTGILRSALYRWADALVCQTPDAASFFPRAIRRKAVVIPNPISDSLPARWEGERRREVVAFCWLEKQKNIPLLVDAFESLLDVFPEYTLSIYGDGSQRSAIESYIEGKGLGESICLHGARDDVHELVRDAAMFVSSSDYEGLSNSMLEAMAIGLPTICTDCPCGGARMVIRNGINGLLVPVGNKEELAGAMSKVASSSAFSSGLSMEASRIRDEFSTARIFSEWRSVIEC